MYNRNQNHIVSTRVMEKKKKKYIYNDNNNK